LVTTETKAGFSQTASTLHHETAGLLGTAPRISSQPGPLIFRDSRNCSRLEKIGNVFFFCSQSPPKN
jgi:hypothetical protein